MGSIAVDEIKNFLRQLCKRYTEPAALYLLGGRVIFVASQHRPTFRAGTICRKSSVQGMGFRYQSERFPATFRGNSTIGLTRNGHRNACM